MVLPLCLHMQNNGFDNMKRPIKTKLNLLIDLPVRESSQARFTAIKEIYFTKFKFTRKKLSLHLRRNLVRRYSRILKCSILLLGNDLFVFEVLF